MVIIECGMCSLCPYTLVIITNILMHHTVCYRKYDNCTTKKSLATNLT